MTFHTKGVIPVGWKFTDHDQKSFSTPICMLHAAAKMGVLFV